MRSSRRTRNWRPDDRGELDGAFAVLTEAVQPGHDNCLDGVRHVHLGEAFDQAIAAVLPPQDAEVEEGLGDLLNEQGYPLRLRHEGGMQLGRELLAPQDTPRHGQAFSLGEAAQRQRGVEAPAPERRRVPDPVRDEEHERDSRH